MRTLIITLSFCSSLYVSAQVTQSTDSIANQELKVAEVVATQVTRRADRNVYTILDRDRAKYFSPLALLECIPGIHFNRLNEEVSINGNKQIAYQVNGVDKSADQVRTLPARSIQAIELIHTPTGKYQESGIKYVVNYVLKDNYTGLDLNLENFTIASLSKHNGDDIIANEQPKLSLQYISKRWNINAGYVFGDFHWNYPLSFKKLLPSGMSYTSGDVSPRHPNELNATLQHGARFGVDFTPNKRHVITMNANYAYTDDEKNTGYHITPEGREVGLLSEYNQLHTHQHDLRGSLAWNGTLSEHWRMEASLNYNRLWSDNAQTYTWNVLPPDLSAYKLTKDYLWQNLSARFFASEKWNFDFGWSNTYNLYKNQNRLAKQQTKQQLKSYRSRVYAYATTNFTQALSMRLGIAGNYIDGEYGRKYNFEPSLTLNYAPEEGIAQAQLAYSLKPTYPKQYQLSPAVQRLDSVLIQQGNPLLAPISSAHELTLNTTLGGLFTLSSMFSYSRNEVVPYYMSATNDQVFATYNNAHMLQSVTSAELYIPLCRFLMWSNTFRLNYYKVKRGTVAHDKLNWGLDSELQYFNQRLKMMAQLSYSRGMITIPSLQGFYETGQDLWQVSVMKLLCNDNLAIQVSYLPPLHFGTRKYQSNEVSTDNYFSQSRLNLRTYDNMLFIRLTFNLHRGKRTKSITDKTQYDNERPAGRGLM